VACGLYKKPKAKSQTSLDLAFGFLLPLRGRLKRLAERGGFEPPVRCKANNGFRDRRIQPLCHLSLVLFPEKQGAKVRINISTLP
jgi:hypothetical protein